MKELEEVSLAAEVDHGISRGVEALLDDYVPFLTDRDYLVVAYAPECREAVAWIVMASRSRGVNPKLVPMRPMTDASFVGRMVSALPSTAMLQDRLVVLTLERDTMSHVFQLRALLASHPADRLTAIRMINASGDLFRHAFNLTPRRLSALNAGLLHSLLPASRLSIRSPAGTDLHVVLDNDRYRWVSNRGWARPGGFAILPAREVATYPAAISGVFVADGAFNVNAYTKLDARLETCPVTVRVERGELVHYECSDRSVRDLLDRVLRRRFATHVGELGFGVNAGIRCYIPMNSHINERRPGIHLGFGQHNQRMDVVRYECDVHLDLIAAGGSVSIDGSGESLDLGRLRPSTRPHPPGCYDEDIDGDCCGLTLEAACTDVADAMAARPN